MPPLRTVLPVEPRSPVLRLIPTPDCEPPYDDLVPGLGAGPRRRDLRALPDAGQGTLPLTFVLPSGVAVLPGRQTLRLVADGHPEDGTKDGTKSDKDDSDDDGLFDPQPTSSADLPDARFWGGRIAQAILEVDCGVRPVAQLRRWASDDVYAQLRWRSARNRATLPRDASRQRPPRVSVRSVRVCEPADGVAEVSAVIHDGRRPRALALRLEGSDGRWRCTVVQHG